MRPPQRTVVYKAGDEVEVIGKEEGFYTSYYEATVVSVLPYGRYEVQYKTLIVDEETKIPLKEAVLAKDLRPVPPLVNTRGEYKLYQAVNTFDNDGWWYGMIVGRISCTGGKGYNVYFSSTNETLPYNCSRIRVHHEFFDAEWQQID